jgi:hypothetical protein
MSEQYLTEKPTVVDADWQFLPSVPLLLTA